MTAEAFIGIFGVVTAALAGAVVWIWNALETRRKEGIARLDRKLEEKLTEYEGKLNGCETERHALTSRVMVLEVAANGDVPKWVRNSDGVIMSVSAEFVRLFGTIHGYKTNDMIGKKFGDLTKFSREFLEALNELDTKSLLHGYWSLWNVKVSDNIRATIIKTCKADNNGSVIYVGYAAPEYHPEKV